MARFPLNRVSNLILINLVISLTAAQASKDTLKTSASESSQFVVNQDSGGGGGGGGGVGVGAIKDDHKQYDEDSYSSPSDHRSNYQTQTGFQPIVNYNTNSYSSASSNNYGMRETPLNQQQQQQHHQQQQQFNSQQQPPPLPIPAAQYQSQHLSYNNNNNGGGGGGGFQSFQSFQSNQQPQPLSSAPQPGYDDYDNGGGPSGGSAYDNNNGGNSGSLGGGLDPLGTTIPTGPQSKKTVILAIPVKLALQMPEKQQQQQQHQQQSGPNYDEKPEVQGYSGGGGQGVQSYNHNQNHYHHNNNQQNNIAKQVHNPYLSQNQGLQENGASNLPYGNLGGSSSSSSSSGSSSSSSSGLSLGGPSYGDSSKLYQGNQYEHNGNTNNYGGMKQYETTYGIQNENIGKNVGENSGSSLYGGQNNNGYSTGGNSNNNVYSGYNQYSSSPESDLELLKQVLGPKALSSITSSGPSSDKPSISYALNSGSGPSSQSLDSLYSLLNSQKQPSYHQLGDNAFSAFLGGGSSSSSSSDPLSSLISSSLGTNLGNGLSSGGLSSGLTNSGLGGGLSSTGMLDSAIDMESFYALAKPSGGQNNEMLSLLSNTYGLPNFNGLTKTKPAKLITKTMSYMPTMPILGKPHLHLHPHIHAHSLGGGLGGGMSKYTATNLLMPKQKKKKLSPMASSLSFLRFHPSVMNALGSMYSGSSPAKYYLPSIGKPVRPGLSSYGFGRPLSFISPYKYAQATSAAVSDLLGQSSSLVPSLSQLTSSSSNNNPGSISSPLATSTASFVSSLGSKFSRPLSALSFYKKLF